MSRNNFNDEKSIHFNILGIIESNLDIKKFGDEKQNAKKKLSFKIKPLIERILSNSSIFAKMNSRYHFFNKQSISFFPKISLLVRLKN